MRFACLIALAIAVILPSKAGAFTAQQVDNGRDIFRLQCARCHGPNGQGIANIWKSMTAPELIGPGALPLNPRDYQKMRHFQFRNVRDVYEFASAVMPADQPASLSAEEYWDVVAYLLDSNGVTANGQMLTEDAAAEMPLAQLQARTSRGKANLSMDDGAPVIEGQGK